MDKITITMPKETAYALLLLMQNSNDTGNPEWDTHAKLIEEQLNQKL